MASNNSNNNNNKYKTSDSSRDDNAKRIRLLVPTVTAKKATEEIDLNSMTEEDLKLLQKKGKQTTRCYCCNDAIVVVRRILVPYGDNPLWKPWCFFFFFFPPYETDPFLYYSIPKVREATLSLKEVDYSEVSQLTCKVSRKTRVSFESHEAVAMNELYGDELDGLKDESLGELDDFLRKLFFSTIDSGSI